MFRHLKSEIDTCGEINDEVWSTTLLDSVGLSFLEWSKSEQSLYTPHRRFNSEGSKVQKKSSSLPDVWLLLKVEKSSLVDT